MPIADRLTVGDQAMGAAWSLSPNTSTQIGGGWSVGRTSDIDGVPQYYAAHENGVRLGSAQASPGLPQRITHHYELGRLLDEYVAATTPSEENTDGR